MRYKHLLDGLEVSIIPFSVCKNFVDFRIDAETYNKVYLETETMMKTLKVQSIDELSVSVQNFGAYSLCNEIEFVEDGLPFMLAQCVRDNYIDWTKVEHITQASHNLLHKSHCKKGQVLVTMAGAYLGKAAVYDKDFICSSNQAIAKITLNTGQNPYFVATFLNSKHGQNQINRLRTVTGQPNINMSLIKELLIPQLSLNFQKTIEQLVKRFESIIEESQTAYQTAEHLLLDALGLRNWQPTQANTAIISLSNSFLSSGRLDAEYYQPKYEQLLKKIQSFEHETLTKLVDIHKSIETGSEAYSDTGIPYVRVSDLTKTGITTPNVHLSEVYYQQHKTLLDKLKIRKNTILLSKDGSIGIAYKVHEDLEMITSGALLHLKINNQRVLPDYLTTVLNSIIVQQQAERDSGGSIIVHWRVAEIEKVIIPILPMPVQQQIATLIQAAQSAQHASKRLLSVAQEAVERAITSGEASALTWIAQNS